MAKNIPKLMKDTTPKYKKCQQTPHTINKTYSQFTVKLQDKRKTLKAVQEKNPDNLQKTEKAKLIADFSKTIMKPECSCKGLSIQNVLPVKMPSLVKIQVKAK